MAGSGASKRKASYHSPLRARQAAETRRSIIDAAVILFRGHGWAATTLPAIAERAGVSVDTIYATFGTKSALLMAVLDVAIVGDDEETSMAERDDFAAFADGRRAQRLRTGVRYTMAVYERSVLLLETLREAAASDAAARARLTQYDRDRWDLVAAGMVLILGDEPGDGVVDGVWALVSPETYTYLIDGRGWSQTEAEDWFVDMTKAIIARGKS